MKLLSIAIPSYNSEGYLAGCIESLLPGGEDVEILVIDDGSRDNTAAIADEYAAKYPTIVKAVHKENGGHGSAVNAGIDHATGLYFKVVDSDDWVKKEAEKRKKVMHYRHILPESRLFGWEDVKRFHKGHYILMHSVIFRTKLLRDCGIRLPEHTFYVDNLYVFEPLMHVKNMYYLDENFYRYYIGREDQSVNETVMISRIDQQIRVNKLMIDFYVDNKLKIMKTKRLHQYMRNYLEIITTVSSVLLIRSETEENLEKKKELWQYMKQKDRMLFSWMRRGIMGSAMNLPGKGGRKISVDGYKICQKIFKFN